MKILILFLGCDGGDAVEDSSPALAGPTLVHTAPAGTTEGGALTFEVMATDEDGVLSVTLSHRVAGEATWTRASMIEGEGDVWSVDLTADLVRAPGVEYWIEAEDAGSPRANAYFPLEGAREPLLVTVSAIGQPLPFVEDFEPAEGEASLRDVGWANASVGFQGYAWDLDTRTAFDGATRVVHTRGYSGTPVMEDWLISPVLDFSSVADAQVTWREIGASPELGDHALYLSTGAADPASGDWVAVADPLPAAPDGAWARAAVQDLSAWAGQPSVRLAWVYRGVDADEWGIDAVRVETLQPLLESVLTVDPAGIGPGESGIATVTVTNLGAVDASDVTVSIAFPEGGASVLEDEEVLASVTSGGAADAGFQLTIDAEGADNRRIPAVVTTTVGATTETLDTFLLIGEVSTAHVALTPWEDGNVQVSLGVGDPADPTWEEMVWSGAVSDAASLDFDVTDQWALLPAAPADGRWYLRLDAENDLFVEAFELTYDGVTQTATVLPDVPGGEETLVYLPAPPEFSGTVTSTPTTLTPGLTGVSFGGLLFNRGSATVGPVVATLTSADADVTVTSGGPFALSAGSVDAGGTVSLSGLFTFDVAATHVDSTDVALTLTLTDDLEAFEVPLAFDVPWPVPALFEITIDDDGRDDVLDPDESAEIELRLSNVGDLPTSGALFGALSVEATSTATATVSDNVESYGTIGAGSSKSPAEPWEVEVTSGAEGDTLDLLLSLYDSAHTYEVRTQLVLGEPPWRPLDSSEDDVGDAVGDYGWDFVDGRWRVYEGVMQIELESAVPFDPSTLFIESWGYSTGADWTYYRLVYQSGSVALEGYDSGSFINLLEPTVTTTSTTIRFEFPVADLGLLLDTINLGFAAGWCGPPDYYCDHYPNNWGYPYYSWNPSAFFELSW